MATTTALDSQTVSAELAFNHCSALIQNNQLAEAETLLAQMQRQQPDRREVLYLLSLLRHKQLRFDEAVSLLQKSIELSTEKGPLYKELGHQFRDAQQFSKATEAFKHAIECGYELPANFHNLADIERRLGNLQSADQLFRTNIESHPEYTLSCSALSQQHKFTSDDPLKALLEERLQDTRLTDSDRANLHFSLGKAHADIGEHETAFLHYQCGNALRYIPFNWQENRRWIESIKTVYDSPARLATSTADAQPVFIVGMPRSGTTLTEQILASHPALYGVGETPIIKRRADQATVALGNKPFPEHAAHLTLTLLNQLAEETLANLASLNHQQRAVFSYVEKNPINFTYTGFILQLFPNAKILHTVRHPLDVILSCFTSNFSRGLDWSFDLAALARVFQDYQSLMRFWHQQYPGKILDVPYEKLVLEQETQTRELLDFVGVDWDPTCLQFHKAERPVQTASVSQVRKPIYRTSLNRWKTYARQLAPAAAILGMDISSEIAELH